MTFFIVIYDRNDSVLYNKTTIVTKLVFVRTINYNSKIVIYDHKECYKLKCDLQMYKTLIVHATGHKLCHILFYCV